jgi:hypothetical protein
VTEGGGQQQGSPKATPAYAFWLILVSIVVVTATFLLTMLIFKETLLEDGPLVIAAMSSSFTVIGTLVGTYFGIKAGRDTQEQSIKAGRELQEKTLEKIPSAPRPTTTTANTPPTTP